MTHEAEDGPVRKSLAEADRLEIARAPSVCLPVAAHER